MALVTLLGALTTLFAAVGDKIYETLIERGLALAESEASLVHGVESEIEKLRRTVDRINALLVDADERRYIEDTAVLLWLRHLKDAAFDADDLLDDYQTLLDASQFRRIEGPANRNGKRPWYHLSLPSLTPADPILLKRRRIAGKISEIRDDLDAIHKERHQFRLRDGDARRRNRAGEESPLPQAGALQDERRVCGREGDVNHLVVELLQQGGTEEAPVVSVVGIAGIGKTTLAGLVFDDMRVRDHFELRIWVSMNKDPDETVTTREIGEAITGTKWDQLSLDILQHRLAGLVQRKKFLLVLDNVWSEAPPFWDTVRRPLLGGKEGSKVLVTTRSEKVANAMGRAEPYHLEGLGFDDCWCLFKGRAFADSQGDCSDFEGIGKEIVERCQGSPLAAKSLGGLLYKVTDKDLWISVRDDMWELKEDEAVILQPLKVSYDHLPLHLKRCFGYCSIFPYGYEFDKDELVKLWIAEGFIHPRGRRRLETIGGKYFNDLLWRSFFQHCYSSGQSKQKYKMPNLINELAQSVSMYECLRMEHKALQHTESRKPRYASIFHCNMGFEILNELYGYESLRTLVFRSNSRVPLKQVLLNLFARLRCLCTLDLGNSSVEELPDSIGDLKHLRYLSFYNTRVRNLPESMSNLYNLQTLELGECHELVGLPKDMCNLVNLRHLGLHVEWDRVTDSISMPPGIGRLTNLQTLSRFTVNSQSGCGIGQLKELDLRGELCILKLENIVSASDAKEANMKNKQYIEDLMLRWSYVPPSKTQRRGVDVEEVTRKLRPHTKLKKLQIENYNGMNFPSWIGDPSFSNLETLTLAHCRRCRHLPSLGQLHKLMKLSVGGMPVLESMSSLPPTLKELEITNCRRLTILPDPHSLCSLLIIGQNETILRWIGGLITLASLTIARVQNLKSIPGSFFQHLTSLTKLKIEECNKLESLAREGVQNLASLESLEIKLCPELTSLPTGLHLLTSLHTLEVQSVPKLTSMPVEGLPLALQNLVIIRCPLLQQKCSRDGADWPKIQHIRNLNVDS